MNRTLTPGGRHFINPRHRIVGFRHGTLPTRLQMKAVLGGIKPKPKP